LLPAWLNDAKPQKSVPAFAGMTVTERPALRFTPPYLPDANVLHSSIDNNLGYVL